MRILVIGGTGFIGRHVVRHFIEMGHDVTVFHRGSQEASLPAQVRHLHGDRKRLAAYLPEFRQIVPHVVMLMVLPLGDERAGRDFVTTFKGIAHRAIVTSSRDSYRAYNRFQRLETGSPDPVPLTEESPLREKLYPCRHLDDPAWSDSDDILVERVVMSEPELPGTVLRLPVIYGPEDHHFHRVFPYLKRMDDRRSAILLDAARASWRDSRVYIEDAASAIALAATNERAKGRVYNVAPPRTLTETEWVESIGRAGGWQGKIVPVPRERLPKHLVKDLDFRHDLALSSERIRNELGYSEQVPFEIGLRKTVEWQRANPPRGPARAVRLRGRGRSPAGDRNLKRSSRGLGLFRFATRWRHLSIGEILSPMQGLRRSPCSKPRCRVKPYICRWGYSAVKLSVDGPHHTVDAPTG